MRPRTLASAAARQTRRAYASEALCAARKLSPSGCRSRITRRFRACSTAGLSGLCSIVIRTGQPPGISCGKWARSIRPAPSRPTTRSNCCARRQPTVQLNWWRASSRRGRTARPSKRNCSRTEKSARHAMALSWPSGRAIRRIIAGENFYSFIIITDA